MELVKVIVKDVTEIDLSIFYESLDGRFSFVDVLNSHEAWERQVLLILRLAREQDTDEPTLEMEIEV